MRENADQNNSEYRHIFCSATIFIKYTFYNCFPTLFQTSPLFQVSFFNHKRGCHGRSHPDMFLGNGVLKICSKFTGEHSCRSATSIRLQSNFIEIILRHGWSPVNLLHFFIDNMNNGENVKGTMLIASRLVIDRIVASTITSTGGPKINDKMIKWKKLSPARYLMI